MGSIEIKYSKKEIVDEKEFCKSLDIYRDKLASYKREKILITSEGKPDMVMISRGEYEVIKSISEEIENMEIEAIIKERVLDREELEKMISEEEMHKYFEKRVGKK